MGARSNKEHARNRLCIVLPPANRIRSVQDTVILHGGLATFQASVVACMLVQGCISNPIFVLLSEDISRRPRFSKPAREFSVTLVCAEPPKTIGAMLVYFRSTPILQ